MTPLPRDPLERYELFRRDPFAFLEHCVWTRDQTDEVNPIKKYPANDDFYYLRFLVRMWEREKKIAVPKSRRMTVSWTFIALALWDCIFHKGRDWAFVSKKEEDSKELVARAEFIYSHIPKDMIEPSLLPKLKRGEMQQSPPALDFEGIYSKIQGFPSGGNQLRQRGFSGIFQDECSFWDDAQKAYASSKPTIDGGGRMVMVSSRAVEDEGFFKRIVFDQLDAPTIRFPEIPPVPAKSPMEGVQVWKNPRNGFTVIELHYTANPKKRGEAFRQALKDTLPVREYRMEYEKSWEAYEGRPVFEDFNDGVHVTQRKPHIDPHLPLLIGWDSSGLTPAAVIGQIQDGQLMIVREIMGTDIGMSVGASRFVPFVKQIIYTEYPQILDIEKETISFYDPAGRKKNEITEETYIRRMAAEGFKQQRPGQQTFKARVDAVNDYLVGLTHGRPKILIYEPDCPTLVAGFRGGYRYADSVADNEVAKPEALKDIHSHPQDALQYICTGLKGYKQDRGYEALRPPKYSFQKEDNGKPQLRKRYVGES